MDPVVISGRSRFPPKLPGCLVLHFAIWEESSPFFTHHPAPLIGGVGSAPLYSFFSSSMALATPKVPGNGLSGTTI